MGCRPFRDGGRQWSCEGVARYDQLRHMRGSDDVHVCVEVSRAKLEKTPIEEYPILRSAKERYEHIEHHFKNLGSSSAADETAKTSEGEAAGGTTEKKADVVEGVATVATRPTSVAATSAAVPLQVGDTCRIVLTNPNQKDFAALHDATVSVTRVTQKIASCLINSGPQQGQERRIQLQYLTRVDSQIKQEVPQTQAAKTELSDDAAADAMQNENSIK